MEGAKDSPHDLPEDEEDTMTSAKGNKAPRKWPLEGFWGGRRGRRKPGESREDKCGEGDIGEGGERETKAEGETERRSESSGDDRWREDKDREDTHSQHSGIVRRMVETSDEREISSSAEGTAAERIRDSQLAWRSKEKKTKDSLRPVPKPKPASLKAGRELHVGSSSDSDGVRFSSTRDGRSQVVSLETGVERPKPSKLRPPKTAKPQLRPKQRDHYQSTQTKETTHQPRQTQSELTPENESLTTPVTSGTKTYLPSRTIPTSHGEIHSPKTPTDTTPLAARLDGSLRAPDSNIDQLMARLQRQLTENDYYQLFGVHCTATTEDLARVRREKSRQLHPDHFANHPEKQERYSVHVIYMHVHMQPYMYSTLCVQTKTSFKTSRPRY